MGRKRKEKATEHGDTDGSSPSSLFSSLLTPSPPPAKKRKVSADDTQPTDTSEGKKQGPSQSDVQAVTDTQTDVTESDKEAKQEREKLQLLLSALSNAQEDQYEIFRRSTFPKSVIRRIMQSVSGGTVPQNTVIAMAGIAKVYVGEIVEAACQAREAMGEKDEGPLLPKHIREAVRILRKSNKVPNLRYRRVFPLK